MKKIAFRPLALFLILCFLIPTVHTVDVFATSADLTATFSSSLSNVPNITSPVFNQGKATGENEVLLSWDFAKVNGSAFSYGTYRLEYYSNDGEKIVFTIKKEGSTADVSYDVWRWNTTKNVYEPVSPVGYEVYASQITAFTPIQNFLDSNYNSDDTRYQVLRRNVASSAGLTPADETKPYTKLKPHFTIMPDTGFSFKYLSSSIVHFRWDATSGNLYFQTNGIQAGRIYDFVLSYKSATDDSWDTDPSWTADLSTPPASWPPATTDFVKTARVMSGISAGTFRSVPFANTDTTVNINGVTVKNAPLDIDADLKSLARVLDLDYLSTSPDKNPGSPDNQIEFRFDVPIGYNVKTSKFDAGGIPNGISMPMTINLNGSKRIDIEINNIFKPSPTNSVLISPAGAATVVSGAALVTALIGQTGQTGPRLGVRIGGLDPNLYFNSARITVTSTEMLVRNTDIGERKVFTFPYYDFRELDGKVYAVVTPYKGYKGYYMLQETGEPAVIIKYDNQAEIWFPLTASPGETAARQYQIFFSPITEFVNNKTDNTLFSQLVNYRAKPSDFMGSPPNNFKVYYNNSRKFVLTPVAGTNGDKGDMLFNAHWDVGNKKAIDTKLASGGSLVLTYNLYRSTSPNNPTDREPSDIFEKVTMTITKGTDGLLYVTYTDANGKILNGDKQLLTTRPNPPTGLSTDVYIANVQFEANAARAMQSGIDFKYPEIYFLNVELASFNGTATRFVSLYDSITLNDFTDQDVPPPGGLTLSDAITTGDNATFHVQYNIPASKIEEYLLNTSITPDTDKNEFYVNLYISQDEKYMTDTFSQLDKAGTSSVDIFHKESAGSAYVLTKREQAAAVVVPASGTTYYFSAQGVNNAMATPEPRVALREGKLIKIKDIPYTSPGALNFDRIFAGLDQNQKYYVYADLYVRQSNVTGFSREKTSILSSLVAITTAGTLEVPGEEEKVPQTPKVTATLTEDGVAKVEWPKIQPATSGETIEYEIIRVKDQRISDTNLSRRDAFETFFANYLPNVEKLGWRTDGDTGLATYAPPWQDTDKEQQEYSAIGDPNVLTDYTPTPNQLYYYYVRTVRILSDGTRVPSLWSGASITTPPVKAPSNLKIENNRTDYDKKTQVTISFDAPIASLDELGSTYQLWYQLRTDGGEWADPVRMDVSALKSLATASSTGDFYHFLYTISGLKPNTGYSVRVRMTDQNNEASLYSNIATFRTDMDQKEYDIEKELEEWNDYLDKELQKLIKDPYWISRDTSNELEVIYRPTMFAGLLSQSADGTLMLVSSEADRAVYYLPASALISANDANKGFRIVHGDMEIILSANAILGTNDALLQVADRIKTGALSDYFIRVTVIWTTLTERVEGNETLSKQAEVRIEAVGSTKNIKSWDDEILAAMQTEITKVLSNNANGLANRLTSSTSSEARLQYIENIVDNAKKDIISNIRDRLNPILNYSYAVAKLDAPLIIVAKGIDPTASVSAYEYVSGTWVSKDVSSYAGGHALYTATPGIFVFTGRVIVIPGIDNVQGGGTITAIVGKYGLDDYFGKDGSFNLEANATGYMVAGSVARMSGAPKGADPYIWLKENKGIVLSTRNMNGNMQTQEALYLVMTLYESKTGTKITTIQIRNYNQTATITGLDSKYKQSVRAAFEVGIYTDTAMQAKNPIKVKEFLQMLNALDAKSKL